MSLSFWIVAVFVSLLVSLALVLGARRKSGDRTPVLKAHYKAQIAAVEQDFEKNLIDADERDSQKAEIGRRLLAESKAATSTPQRPAVAWTAALSVPVVALLVYGRFGSPELQDIPQADRLAIAEHVNDIDAMVYRVEQHLLKNPNDIEGWQVILPTYVSLQRYAGAAQAYKQLIRLSPPNAELQAGYAEVLAQANGGQLPPDAVEAIDLALLIDRKNPKARYYSAVNAAQKGDTAEAIKRFEALLADTPADAPWRVSVLRYLQDLKASSAKPPALTEEQIAAAQGMDAAQQQEMIKGMVDGLAARLEKDPHDLQGWLRLIRARTVLKDTAAAETALNTARKTFASQPQALNDLNSLATELKLK